MAIYDLSSPNTTLNIAEDLRGPARPVAGSPFTVSTTATVVLPVTANRATASIINTGSGIALLAEGSTPSISGSNFSILLPPNRMWEPDSSFRFTDAVQAIAAAGTTTLVVSQSVILL